MRKVITHVNVKPSKGKKVKGKSLTIQDDSVSVAELMRKHIAGEDVQERKGVFVDDADLDDEDGEKFFQLDRTDQDYVREGIRAMSARLKALEDELQEEQKRRAETAQGDEPQKT